MRIKIRVPAGTVTAFPPCAPGNATLPETVVNLAEEALPKEPCADPSANPIAAATIRIRMSFLSFIDSRLFFDNRQRRSNLEIDDQQRSEEHTSELQSQFHLVCRLLLE